MIPEYDFTEGFLRVDAALSNVGSDTIPFYAQMHEFCMIQKRVSGAKFYTDPEMLVRGCLDIGQKMRFDVPDLCWDVYNIEAEALGQQVVFFDDNIPALDNANPIIKTEKELAALKPPDPYKTGRMPFVLDCLNLFKALTGVPPIGMFCAPYTLTAQIMGFENVIDQIYKNPKFVHKTLTFVTEEVLAPFIQAQFKSCRGITTIDGSDALSSLPFLTQEMLEEFCVPYILRLKELCGEGVVVQNWWGDSYAKDLDSFWNLKLQISPNFLKVQDPDLFKVGVQRAKTFADDKGVAFIFGVDNNLLQKGPSEEIKKRIHEYLEIGEPGGRTLMYLCSISAQTPAEHVQAAVDAIHSYRQGDRPYTGISLSGTTYIEGSAVPEAEVHEDTTAREETETLLDDIYDAVLDFAQAEVVELVKEALEAELDIHEILNEGLISAMDTVGDMFTDGTIFVPEMLMAANTMKAGLGVLKPILTKTASKPKGTIVLATVHTDLHDIGKNMVGMMLEGGGFQVVDLGVNVPKETVIEAAIANKADVVGLSALLTTSMPAMAATVAEFKEQYLPSKIIVGGAPVTREFADTIGADGYADDAPGAVTIVREFIEG